MKIIDFHTHIGDVINGTEETIEGEKPFRFIEYLFEKMEYRNPFGRYPSWIRLPLIIEIQKRHGWGTRERLIESMEKNRITACVVHPIEPIQRTERILAECDGKKLIPFASCNPKDPQSINSLPDYIKRGCKGVKLHPILQKTPPYDPSYFNVVEEIRKFNIPVLFHSGKIDYLIPRTPYPEYGRIENFEKIVKAFPDVKFILAHMGLEEGEKAIGFAEKFKNVYLDTSFQPLKMIQKAVNKIGERRLLFASDWPNGFHRTVVRIYEKLRKLMPDKINFILHKNAEELLNIEEV